MQTRAELTRLHERLQATVIYVTHDQVEAMTMGERIAVLNLGVLQQLDTPQNLYNHPTNHFVAGFIGSPAMNFFDGELVQAEGGICFRTDELMLKVDAQHREALAKHLGKAVVFGIRPEHIADRRDRPEGPQDTVVETRVDVLEHLGNETLLYLVPLLVREQPVFIARMGPDSFARPGHEFEVVLDMRKAHVFEKESGQAII